MERFVAVITPVYNGVNFIQKAINSVQNQTYKNIRHYIYNDCSVDETDKILLQYQNNTSFCIMQGVENKGQSFARNELINQAIEDGAEFISFLDMDDLWTDTHIEENINSLDNNDLIYSKPKFLMEDGQTAVPYNIPIPEVFIGKQLYHNNFIWISSVLGKAEIFKDCKFDSQLDSIEDWDLWIQLYRKGFKFTNKKSTTVEYLIRNGGSAGNGELKQTLFDKKNSRLPYLKLHLACGHDYQSDYINVDLYPTEGARIDAQFDVAKLPYDDNSVDEIRAFHIIEHFDWHQGQRTLEEWYRVLKPGGRLWLETPDFLASCDAFVKGDPGFRNMLYGHFFAMPWIPGQTHKFLFTEEQLRIQLGWAGFKQTNRLPPCSGYVLPQTINLFLNVESFK